VCSSRQIAKWLDRPAAVIPARWSSIRFLVAQLHHARLGVTAKTVANHKANVKAALRWFCQEHDMPHRGIRLSVEWVRFGDRLDKSLRDRLYSLMRYCSARGLVPTSVDDTIFDEHWRYRTATTARASNNTARRFMVRAWNAAATIHGGLLRRLTEPPLKVAEPAWNAFPDGLRKDLDDYFAGLTQVHRTLNGKRIEPCSPATIATRRAEMVAMARMAIRLGVKIESLTSLRALLHPDLIEKVIDAYWRKNGEEPKTGTIDRAPTTRSVDNSIVWLPGLGRAASMRGGTNQKQGRRFVAKRKKGSKVQSRAKLRRANSAKRPKARKAAKAVKRTVAKAKPKRAPVKEVARKAKPPVASVVETVAAEVIEQPAPGLITVTEIEESEVRKAS
jgi:hypothetical protein